MMRVRVDAEVGLQRLGEFDAFGDVDEGASREGCVVERGEFVVADGDDFAEPGAEDVFVVAQAFGGVDEDDAFLAQLFLHVVVGGLGVVLGVDAGKEGAFLLRDAEALEGALDVVGDFIPALAGGDAVGEVVADFVEVHAADAFRRPVGGHGHVAELLECFFAELTQPVGFALGVADVVDGVFREAVAGVEAVVFREGELAARVDAEGGIRGRPKVGGGVGCCLRHGFQASSLRKSKPFCSMCSTSS